MKELESIDKSMSEMFRQHDYSAMYDFYRNYIRHKLEAIQALQPSHNFSAEDVLKETWTKTEGGDRWVNDNKNVKYYREDIVLNAMKNYAIQALQQRESEWISVEDRLPEPKQFVLVYGILNKEVGKNDTKPSIGLVMWNVPMASDCKDEDQYSMWYTDITHWMPLPKKP